MDDQNNGEYSRTPELKDLILLCRSLNQQGAKYVLIGGFAVMFHGFARTTKDIDFLVEASAENVAKIKKALSILPDNAISQIEDDELQRYPVVRVADEVVVGLMAKACGLDYEQASSAIEFRIVEGVKVPLVNKEMLLKLKDTVRPGDKMDSDFLRARI